MSTKKRKSESPKKTDAKVLIYCGPSLRNLQQYSIYRGEPPESVKYHMKESAAIKSLFVSPGELATTKNKINRPGTKENLLYKKALKYSEGGSN